MSGPSTVCNCVETLLAAASPAALTSNWARWSWNRSRSFFPSLYSDARVTGHSQSDYQAGKKLSRTFWARLSTFVSTKTTLRQAACPAA
jgi:hypothetical protein